MLKPFFSIQSMGKYLQVFFLLLNCHFLIAQRFVGYGGKISDIQPIHKIDSFFVDVSGIADRIDGEFGLAKVCLNIVHPRVSDLKIELISPDGTGIWLTNRNGGDQGSGYYGTCFRVKGHSGYVHQARAPFTGEFIPDGRMEFLNNGQNPNGTWVLLVQDLRAENEGVLNQLELHFERDPMPGLDKAPCQLDNGAPCACPDPLTDCELLPDLVVLPNYTIEQVREYAHNDPNYPAQLRFGVAVANIGDGPMETYGNNEWYCDNVLVADSSVICHDGTHPRQKVFQRVYRKENDSLVYQDSPAGTNYFEDLPGHNHYHNDDWVEFRLVKKEGKRKKVIARVATGRKISYCLFDSGICDDSRAVCEIEGVRYGVRNLPNYGLGRFIDCSTPGAHTGISVGAYDAYGIHFEGQHIDLPKGLKSGDYFLEIEVDPTRKYKEKNRENNVLSVPVRIQYQES